MASGYTVAIILEVIGMLGLISALVLIRKERLSKAAGLRGYFGDGSRRLNRAPRVRNVSVRPVRAAGGGGGEASALAALRRALLTA